MEIRAWRGSFIVCGVCGVFYGISKRVPPPLLYAISLQPYSVSGNRLQM